MGAIRVLPSAIALPAGLRQEGRPSASTGCRGRPRRIAESDNNRYFSVSTPACAPRALRLGSASAPPAHLAVPLMHALIETLLYVLQIYQWVVICAVIASWLVNYGVINRYNRPAMQVVDILYRLTEPVLRPIRRFLPNLGGLDLSPLVLLVIIFFLEHFLAEDLAPLILR